MTIWWLVLILAAIGSVGIAFIWLAVRLNRLQTESAAAKPQTLTLEEQAEQGVNNIFSEDFREELRNRGRLHFEKIIGENAMFLQQDLRLTTSQLNEYMKTEITRTLKQEFDKYEQSIMDAKQMAVDAIQKTNSAIDEQRQILNENLQTQVATEKKKIIDHFDAHMAEIVNHYILSAVGDQIDLSDQLEYIIGSLRDNKAVIIEDIQSGA